MRKQTIKQNGKQAKQEKILKTEQVDHNKNRNGTKRYQIMSNISPKQELQLYKTHKGKEFI